MKSVFVLFSLLIVSGCTTFVKQDGTPAELQKVTYVCDRDVNQSHFSEDFGGVMQKAMMKMDCMNAHGWYTERQAARK